MIPLQTSSLWRNSKRIAAVAASEDASTDSRVIAFCECLARQLRMKPEISRRMWLFSELRTPQLRSVAAAEAAASDLIIISLHHQPSLPEDIDDWLGRWINQKSKKTKVLVALFDAIYEGDSTSIQVYLQNLAQRSRVEFVSQNEESPHAQ